MADVSVRPARPQDAEPVAHLQLQTWKAVYGDLLPAAALELPLEQVAAVWLNAIEAPPSPRHRLLVALEQAEVVGFAASEPATDDDLGAAPPVGTAPPIGTAPPATQAHDSASALAPQPAAVELTAFLIEPRWSRRGHGSRLLTASVDHWRGDGFATAVHWAFEADTVLADFLASAGWGFDGQGRGLDTGPRVVPQRRLHTNLAQPPA